MTGTELVNILKSPTSKIIFFGVLLIGGALVLIPMLNRDEDPSAIQENTELKQEEKAPIEIGSGIPQFKADRESEKVQRRHRQSFPVTAKKRLFPIKRLEQKDLPYPVNPGESGIYPIFLITVTAAETAELPATHKGEFSL